MKEIEDFLRENKPVVKDNPTFILEAQRRMEAVEGIKGEVDRQRCYGRLALIITLMAGLFLGVVATAIAYLYPLDADTVGQGILDSIRQFLTTWKQHLLLPVALLAIALSLVLMSGKRSRSTF
jgi:hypothetical protein